MSAMIEFHTDYSTGQAFYRFIGEDSCRELKESDTDIIKLILDNSKSFYPDQYDALEKEYSKSSANKLYYDFLRARRIVNCCFGENDCKVDLDRGVINFELVKCPRMAECKYYKIICQPKFNTKLSERESEVMKLYYNNVLTEDIAEKLFISIHTVNNHRKNALRKLNLHSIEEFIAYAFKKKMYDDDI